MANKQIFTTIFNSIKNLWSIDKIKQRSTAVYLVLFIFSQLNFSNASELYSASVNNSASHLNHSENLNPYNQHEINSTLASVNPAIVNPNIDTAQVVSSVLHSSLNLSSPTDSFNVGNLPHSVNINVDGHSDNITSNQYVTPAEAVAVSQVLANSHQSLILGENATAIGGSLNTSNLMPNNIYNTINNLELPSNVTLIAGNNLVLKGDLQNYGDIVFNNNGNLQANLILNENSGLISSSGNLNITTNALINENGGVYAENSLNLNTPVIYNSGTIEANLGNINVISANNLDITQSTNSIIEASNGSINLNSNAQNLSNGLNLAIGNYLSKELNLNANQGYIDAGLNNVSGQINSLGSSEHIITQGQTMIIGNSNIKGDPTYDSTGNILIDGAIATNGNNLAIVAGGNIGVTAGSITSINTTSSSGNGGNLVMIAGVGSNLTGYTNQTPTITPGLTGETSTISVALGATSGNTGGNIDLSTGNSLAASNFVIYTNGTGTNSSGGNVTLVAQANGSTGGQINVGNSTNHYSIYTPGTGTGTSGNVLLIATGNSGTSTPYTDISVGYITTGISTSTGTGGNISLYAANPTTQTVTFDNTGTIGSGQTISANTASLIPGIITASNVIEGSTGTGTNSTIMIETGLTANAGITTSYLLGDNIYLLTAGANIGSLANGIEVSGTNLTINTNSTGTVYMGCGSSGLTTNLTLNGWTGNNFYFSGINQPLIIAGPIIGNSTSGNVALSSLTGSITVNSNITANIVNLSANNGSIIENSSTAVVASTGSNLSLTASVNIGSTSQSLITNSAKTYLYITNNSANTYIENNYTTASNTLNVIYQNGATTTGTFNYSTSSDLVLSGNIISNSTVDLAGVTSTNAGISIGANELAATTSITIAASGSGNITETSFNFTTLQTPDLVLSSGTGNIGTPSIPIFAYTNGSPTSTVAANTGGTGNVYLEISPQFTSGTITFNASTAGGTFSDYGTGNSIIVNGNIVAPVISLGGNVSSIFNTSLTLNASVIGSASVSLYALNAGSIIQSSTSDAISAPTVNLITVSNTLPPPPYGTSNIGSATNPLVVTNVGTALNVGTTGAVYISSPNTIALGNIGASSSMPSSFQLVSAGDITSAGTGYMAYAGSITLTANGTNGIGTTNSYVNVNTPTLTATADAATTSSAYINDAYSGGSGITLGIGNPSITIGANGTLGFEASNNAIIIGASISASEIDLTANGAITQATTSDTLIANTVNLQTHGGAIGSSTLALNIITSNLGVNTALGGATAGANAYISDSTGPVTIGTVLISASDVGTGGTYSLTQTASNGEIIIGGAITGNTIDLTSTSSGSGIGGIQEAGAGVGTLTATNVNLTDTGVGTGTNAENIGATGTGSTGSILTLTANLAVTTTLGSAYLSNYGAVALGASSVNSANGNYVLTTSPDTTGSDSVTIGNNSVSGFNISISTSTPLAGGNANIIQSGTGSLQAVNDNLTLSSAGNIGASGNPILVNSIFNNLQAVGNVYVSDASTTSYLSGANYSGNNVNPGNTSAFDFIASSAGSAVTVNSAASVNGGVVTLQSDASSSSLVDFVGSVTGNISINILSGSSISSLATTYTTPILNLTSTFGSIGSSLTVLSVDAAQVSANANAASQNVYISDTYSGNTSIGNSGAGSLFYFVTSFGNALNTVTSDVITSPTVVLAGASVNANLANTSTLTAEGNSSSTANGIVDINDTGVGGSLTLASQTVGSNVYTNEGVNTGGTGSYTLSADNTSTTGILTLASSSVTANTISLTSTAGNIGEAGGIPSAVILVSPNLALSAVNGSIYATDSGNSLLTITNNSPISSSGTFSLTNSGSILVSANIGTGLATSGTVELTTTGSSTYTINSSVNDYITAGTVSLNTSGSDIGNSGQGINVETANLVASTLNNSSTTGSAYINDSIGSTVNLGLAPVPGTNVANISVGSAGTLSLTATVANINVAGNVSVGAGTGSGTIDLTSDTTSGTGAAAGIISGASNTLTAGNINLNTNGSDIGSVGTLNQAINVNTANLSISTLNNGSTVGSVYINYLSATTVNLGLAPVPGSNVANISLGSAGTLSLTATLANINVAGNVNVGSATGTGTIDLTSDTISGTGTSAGIISGAGNVLTAGAVNLNTNGSDIGSGGTGGQGINVNTANLSVNGNSFDTTIGSVYINDSAATTVNLGLAPVTGSNVANIIVGPSSTLSLTATVANINVAGNVSVGFALGFGTIDLTSDTTSGTGTSAGIISGASNTLTAGTINLNTNGSDIGSGGTGGQSINVNTANLSVSTLNNSSTTGSAYISDVAIVSVNLNASSVGGTNNVLNLTSNSSLFVNGLVTAGSNTGSGSINLTLTGNGSVSDTGNLDVLQAGTVNFNTAGGNIGGQFSVLVDTSNISVNTLNSGATTGYAYITDSAANLNLNSSSVSTQTYSSTTLSMYITNSGNININGLVSAGISSSTGSIGIASLNSNANITDSGSGSLLTAGFVHVQTAGGNIGSSSQNVLIDTNNFNITTLTNGSTTGSAYISDSSTATVNIGDSAHVISVGSSGTLSLTTTLANINVANIVSVGTSTGTGTIDLTVSGSNAISQSSTSDLLTAGTVNLTAGSTNFGSSLTNLFTVDSSNLSANTTGSAYLQDNATTTNILTTLLGNTLILNTAGTVNTNGNVQCDNITINTANNGYITINAGLGLATANVSLNANGAGYITTGTNGLITGNSLSLVSTNGEIGFNGNGLLTQVNNVVFSSQLSVGIYNHTANLNIAASSSNANVYVENTGNITASGMISAPVLGLYSFNGTSGVGSANSLINVNAVNLAMSTLSSSGSAYINDTYTGNVTVQQSIVGGVLKLDTVSGVLLLGQIIQGTQALPGQISGSIIAIATNGGFGILNVTNLNSNDFIFLTASQNGYIAQQGTGNIMSAPNVALVSGGGAIGGAGGTSLLVNSGMVAASTVGAGSYVNIYDEATNSGINGGQSGSYFTFNTNGNVNIYGSIATGAGVTANGGNLNISANGLINVGVASSVSLLANSGNIVVQDNNTTSGAIHLYNGDTVSTKAINPSLGSVVFNIGSYNASNNTNPNPGNISVNTTGSGKVYFGNNSITATASGNVLNAINQNIIFNTGSLSASAITLDGKVNITADPVANNNVNSVNKPISTQELSGKTALYMPIAYHEISEVNEIKSYVIKASQNLEFKVLNNSITLKAGAIVLIAANNTTVSIYNLHDRLNNSIKVNVGNNKEYVIKPGSQLTISLNNSGINNNVNCDNFASINMLAKVGYRAIKCEKLNKVNVFKSDYSIISAMAAIKSLKLMGKAHNQNVKNAYNDILKTATVVSQTTSYKGLYERQVKSESKYLSSL